ncbi:MAG TPA: multidrug effflux MFS transporter [Verrucomicrobiae bacterium]|nr:multidrug effflux MFS transporter [Verrucomicrobiae bacterium]
MSKESHNRLFIVLILGSLSTLSPFAIDMYLPAFPEMAAALHVSTAKISLSIATYFAGLAVGQIIYGPLLDRLGRKIPLYFGLALFMAASLLCLGARTVEELAALRFLQALGGCAAQVGSMAMVRDFFPVQETAKIISWLILILGVSPLLAPTVGSYVALHGGWRWVFIILAAVAFLNLLVCWLYLPEGHEPDDSVSLRPGPILRNFWEVLRHPQFLTFSVAGAFAFSGLLVYVTSSPIIFMEVFHVSARTFGMIFAGLATGFIGSNQINVLLLRRFSSEQIFLGSLWVVCPTSLLLLAGVIGGWFGLAATLALLFVLLSCLGLAYPNAAALALSPIDHNIGSASAMLGFLQIGISGAASASIGLFDSHGMMPVAVILSATSWVGLGIFLAGRRHIGRLKFVEEKGAHPIVH